MKTVKNRIFYAIVIVMVIFVLLVSCQETESGGFKKGILTSTTWESEFLNMKFTCPAEYIMATETEIEELIEFSGEIVFEDKDKKIIDYAKAKTVYELFVQTPSGMPNASLLSEKVLANMSVEQYIDTLKEELASVGAMEVNLEEKVEKTMVAGQEYSVLTATVSMSGIDVVQEYLLRKQDDRMVAIILTYSEDIAAQKQALLDAFEAYR